MKILQINSQIGSGSVGRIVLDLHDMLVQQGDECRIAYGRGKNQSVVESDCYKIGNMMEVCTHTLLTRITDRTGFYFANSTKKLIQWIEEYNPDIIHMHGNYGYYINIEVLMSYLAKKNIPVVNTLHSCWDFTGHCCYFDYVNCDRWKTGCYSCPQKKSYPSSLLFDASKENYVDKKRLYTGIKNMTIVTPSKWLEKLVSESYLNKYPVLTINNGIDLNVFKPIERKFNKYNIDVNKKIILGVSNGWEKRKGIEDFYELAEIIGDDMQIVLLGLKEEQRKKLPNNIIGIKRTENIQEMVELYSIADVLFNPTYEDNYPTVNLEAIACGTPVVTYDTGGSGEIIRDKNYGLIIEYKDYSALLKFISSNEKSNLKIDELYALSKERMIDDYRKLYKNMLEKCL